ncbi:DUF922 domain-containing Zn-dependent protease [Bacteriovoracales bacterium]|nr:DUF922 domain-containing Zn-dependent protease [Bacteriovoracales bacterium]
MEKRKIYFLYLIFILSFVGCATSGKNNLYYDVKGTTLEEIKESMNQQRKIHAKGKDAYTKWSVRFNFKKRKDGGNCTMERVDVSITSTTMMPRLINLEELSPELQDKWKVYLKNQLKHQMMQEEFAVKAKKELKEMLLAMKEVDCSKLNRDANTLGDSIVQKYGEFRDAYNKKTDYGVKNGAIFR